MASELVAVKNQQDLPSQHNEDVLLENDFICLSCNLNTQDGSTRVALAAEGFGNRKCFTEPLQAENPEPPDLSICAFMLEQALSVRALQEMINSPHADATSQAGSRTLLYGHAVLLRHCHSDMYLSCLTTSSSNDKLAFDVGLTAQAKGESCWWTIHPASKQRSEGEKVRVGDDFILVSVSSERYLHIGNASCVIASFQQTLWTVVPVSSGTLRQKSLGQVFGGDVLRFFHGDECLTLPEAGSENIFESVMYETGGVCSQARSLWRVQHVRVKWYGGFMGYGRPVRIRHVTSGRYLGVTPDHKLVTHYRLESNNDTTIFLLRDSKDDKKQLEEEEEGMGLPEIKYGDSMVVVQHAVTGYWLSYHTYETKKRGIGKVEVKQAVMLEEGHMDDGLAFTRAQDEESRSALVIRKCTSLFNKFIKGLASLKDSLDGQQRNTDTWSKASLEEVLHCLQDLIEFFAQPDSNIGYEAVQKKLHALRNRQNLFQEEGMIALVLDTIDQFSVYKSPRHFANYAGEEAATLYEEISSYLYLLLASMIQGNRANCAQFAQVSRLDWLVDRLQSQQASKGVLKVLHCVLIDSPEALTMIKEPHIQNIISLLDKHGRDPKVLEVLCSLCVGNDIAVRTNQNLICDNLLPTRDLLLQTKVVDTVISMRPNIFIGLNEGAAMYKKWYYEVVVDHVETTGNSPPHLRVGWANIEGYRAYPASGSKWGCNGIGDDLYSYAYDGLCLWTGGKRKQVRAADTHLLQKGDTVGCCLDLSIPAISFSLNGYKLKAVMKDFNMTGMFFPVISMSAKASCRFMLGGEHGKLKHGPPEGYAPVFESLLPKEKLKIEPCFNLGDVNKGILYGPSYVGEHQVFVPNPIDTSHVQLPSYIESVRDKLAENIHELWALGKIEQGWTFGEYRDDVQKKHPCLTTFERLPASERQYDITLAFETLRTLLALGYHISVDNMDPARRMKYQKLPASHLQTNGYKPMPLDLAGVLLNDKLEELVDQLAENTHNVWARDRIRQGWTYGQCDDTENKRSCHLVPYSKVDASIKKANRETASETIRTLLAYGYNVEPPNPEAQGGTRGLARHITDAKTQCRVLRPALEYAVNTGKWYFEFEMLTAGLMRVGWAKDDIGPSNTIGDNTDAYVFDGYIARKWHGGAVPYGKTWQIGDIVGCMLDMSNGTVTFSMNGELMMDMTGQEIAFKDIAKAKYVPIIMLGPDQRAKINYGMDPHSLKYYTCCGLQEGYEPFCINMTRPMPLWYVRGEGRYVNPASDENFDVSVTRVQKSASNCPAIKIASKSYGTLGAKTSTQFLRISLPVKCNDKYAPAKLSSQSDSQSPMTNGFHSPASQADDQAASASSQSHPNKRMSIASTSDMSLGSIRSRLNSQRGLYAMPTPTPSQSSLHHSSNRTLSADLGVTQLMSLSVPAAAGAAGVTLKDHKGKAATPQSMIKKAKSIESLKHLLKRGDRNSTSSSSNIAQKLRQISFRKRGRSLSASSKSLHRSFNADGAAEDAVAASESRAAGMQRGSSVDEQTGMSSSTDMLNGHESKSATLDSNKKHHKFNFLKKKGKSRDPSPSSAATRSSGTRDKDSSYSDAGFITAPPDVVPTSGRPHPPLSQGMSEASYGSDSIDLSAVELQELEMHADNIDTYYYGLRLLPGQDPNSVYVGWFTSNFNKPNFDFTPKCVRHVNLGALDGGSMKTSISRREMYMVHAGEVVHKFGSHDLVPGSAAGRDGAGTLIGCFINTSNGFLTFTLNGRELPNKFQVEPGTRLFPSVIYEPTSVDNLHFEIGRTKTALPISSSMFRGGKQTEPQCPSRLDVQVLTPSTWSRAPNNTVKVHRMKMSDVKGWSMLTEETVGMLAVHVPEEDRCVDTLELPELTEMLTFHAKTLQLYCAICSHGNFRAAHELIKHVDEKQLMHAIQDPYLSGALRMGFHDLLNAMHLDAHSKIRLLTEHEYVFPLKITEPDSQVPMYRDDIKDNEKPIMYTVPDGQSNLTIRPKLALNEQELEFLRFATVPQLSSPLLPLDRLKRFMMKALMEAVNNGAGHIRDPIGGSCTHLFVPILKTVDNLLVMGLVEDTEIKQLLRLIDPVTFSDIPDGQGLLQMHLEEDVKIQLCNIFHHLCDAQVRHRTEALFTYSAEFVHRIQREQLDRYRQITSSVMSPAIAAKKTKEFRSSPREQMRSAINFINTSDDNVEDQTRPPPNPELEASLSEFHDELMKHCRLFEEEVEASDSDADQPGMLGRLFGLNGSGTGSDGENDGPELPPDTMQKLIAATMIKWSKDSLISRQELVRQMFSLLYRQYDALGEVINALGKTYIIGEKSIEDLYHLMKPLCNIRSLLTVQGSKHEEDILKNSLAEIMDNKIFFQHPDLMRLFCVHETSMQLMVATLNKSQQENSESDSSEMVVMCCKFLCYFCRISRKNQQAMFEHLGYLLANSSMLLVRPSLRGSCPLDVAYSSLMDNNELALALRESHLERIVAYLSRAGVQSNPELLASGYPDIGWDPVEGERFLDFLRFCVWVNGESVEENANLVVRLLIRRPECLGPALRGESGGGGLLKAMKYGIVMSEQIAAARDSSSCNFLLAMADSNGKPYLANCKYDLSSMPSEDDEDYIDMGSAILSFYSTLVDLLGRCAPSEETIKAGRSDSVRARAILQSLVSMEDLEGILSLHFLLPEPSKPDSVPPGLTPEHKAAMLMFFERVYGIDDQEIFFRLIENGFLADLRTSTTLDSSGIAESDFALALNRYLCGSVLPLLTKHATFFENADHKSQLMDSLLHTVYRLSKCRSLTAGQFRTVTDFLVAHTSHMRPIMMMKLLSMLTVDLPALTENTVISLRMLTHHYERCSTYYSSGHPEHGMAGDEEKRLTMVLFTRLFDALAQRPYEPELFSRALPCLAAIGCALSPDCAVTGNVDDLPSPSTDEAYVPKPTETKKVPLPANVGPVLERFAEHYHDIWCSQQLSDNWQYGEYYDEDERTHPSLIEFVNLRTKEQKKLIEPADDAVKALVAWGWQISYSSPNTRTQGAHHTGKPSIANMGNSTGSYCPSPVDLKNVTISRDMVGLVDKLAEHQHAVWAKKKRAQLDAVGGGIHPLLVPYDMLTVAEKEHYRKHVTELFRFLQTNGFRIANTGTVRQPSPTRGGNKSLRSPRQNSVDGNRRTTPDDEDPTEPNMLKRFAFSLLEKLLEYVDKSAHTMVVIQSSKHFTKTDSFNDQSEEIKFFGKVVLPLMNKYFAAHQSYFMGVGATAASTKEKEMVASLFCKLSSLLRHKLYAFGSDIHITVQCLVCICQAVDARSVVKNSTDIARTQMTPLFMNAAEDLTTMVENLKAGRFSHIKGTLAKGHQSLDYVHMVVLPVLSALFSHLAVHNFGTELLVNDIQLACYRVLHSLYTMGAHSESFVQREQFTKELLRHRPALGECVASFAACFPVAFLEPKYNISNKYSIVFQVPVDQVQEHSLEAHEIMSQLAESIPQLDVIADTIKSLATQEEGNEENLHIIEVTLPMLCSYLPKWWASGPDGSGPQSQQVTSVTSDLMNSVLGDVLTLIQKHIGVADAPWMNRIAMRTQAILFNATESMLTEYIIPMANRIRGRAVDIRKKEEAYCVEKRNNSENASDLEEELTEEFQVMVRDLYASYPVLIRYVDLYRSGWIKEPHADAEILFDHVAHVFNFWSASNTFRRAETTFVNINEINNMTLIMPSSSSTSSSVKSDVQAGDKKTKKKGRKKEGFTSLVVAAIKRLLPIGLNVFGGPEQELVQMAKEKMIEKEPEVDIEDLLRVTVASDSKDFDPKNRWQKALYLKMGKSRPSFADLVTNVMSQEALIEKIMTTAKVLYGLHLVRFMVEHPLSMLGSNWKKVISTQRKKAVMACFRMVPLHNLHRHRAINLFMSAYSDIWLCNMEWNQTKLIEDLTEGDGEDEGEEATSAESSDEVVVIPDPLKQLVQALSRQAQADQSTGAIADDDLYLQYTDIMGKSCSGEDEEEDGDGEEETLSFQEQEMQKQKLLFEQGRLANRASAEMLLLYISASKGVPGPMVSHTIDCGIALLLGGNVDVQQKMLDHLQEKKDVGFFIAMSGFMQQCSVLDLDAFERTNKAESLGVVSTDGSSSNSGENLQDADFTCKLFRFLQLLCEGHNANWQNYLRTQVGNNTTVNLVISTVDYLLRIQESMMDFYWHYSGKETIDDAGKLNFIRAIRVGKQLFAALTEYIQGPCQGNQLTLAHSRLWDAVGGFLFIFAHMQDKLSRDPEQLELLREFMNLQKEMMIMLLSMLEGNVMNGPIGKQMVDTLVESSANFEMILKFFDIFLKMKDMTSSEAFLEYDLNKDGYISPKEFRYAMQHQKIYAREEIDYIMMCVDANQDGKVDFLEFTERFHNPAKDIGFNVALLLTNLAEHMPNDPRLERFLEKAKSVLDYFEMYLGRIEIMGSAGRIERVYFEITQSHINQWEKPQIKESKRSFLHNIVNEEGDNEKIESFVNFCEDTIFEMQHATSISAEEQDLRMAHAKALRAQAGYTEQVSTVSMLWEGTKTCLSAIWSTLWFILSLLTISNIKHGIATVRGMTFLQLVVASFRLGKKTIVFIGKAVLSFIVTFFKWILAMMMGEPRTHIVDERIHCLPPPESFNPTPPTDNTPSQENGMFTGTPTSDSTPVTPTAAVDSNDNEIRGDGKVSGGAAGGMEESMTSSVGSEESSATTASADTPEQAHVAPIQLMQAQMGSEGDQGIPPTQPAAESEEDLPPYDTPGYDWGKYMISLFARNFYNFKMAALVMAFMINFLLLFYRVTTMMVEVTDEEAAVIESAVEEAAEECEIEEMISMEEKDTYLQIALKLIAIIHSLTSLSMLIAYYCLKVPLVIFKREKSIARKLEFEGMWIAEEPGGDELGLRWDRLVLSTHSFPAYYWDKFVKKKVKSKYSEQFDPEEINALLAIEKSAGGKARFEPEVKKSSGGILPAFLSDVDWKYEIWKWGVILSDNDFLYLTSYLVFSMIGNYNHFFFAAHLMDVAFSIKTLGTILQSVTHNGKQLILTVMLTAVVVYIYSVIAFNFFRKFYAQEGEEGDDPQFKCNDLLTCFVFHLHTGVRAGGGIGDEIESADGDPYEVARILFDITFFFFVIVILLAIIQGLIIDAFGELRSQLEQVKEDMESSCFICGIGKDYFDEQPHGFERHVMKEHNFANYMFFLMHLINKPDTEYTGQETYVWEMYSNRCWDFFPVGDCFRKQYDSIEE